MTEVVSPVQRKTEQSAQANFVFEVIAFEATSRCVAIASTRSMASRLKVRSSVKNEERSRTQDVRMASNQTFIYFICLIFDQQNQQAMRDVAQEMGADSEAAHNMMAP